MQRYKTGMLALLTAAIVAPGTARAESLADAMVLALKTSPELKSGRANVKVLGERAYQARAGGRVNVEGVIDITTLYFDLDDWRFPTELRLDVTQPIYTGGQVENATEAAEIRITAEQARLIATEQDVLRRAVTAYMDVRRDEVLLQLSRNNVRVIGEQLRAARERFEVGEVTRTDVAQAEARLAAARSAFAAATGRLQTSREAYRRVVGQYPGKLAPPPPLPDLPKDVAEAVSIGLRDDPNITSARLERRAASVDVRAAIGGLLPRVSLLGRVRHGDTLSLRNDDRTDASVGIRIVIPFYDGGTTYSQVREAQAFVEVRSSDVTGAMRQTVENIGTSWSDLAVAAATIRSGQLQVEAASIAFEGVREEAKVGARTTLEVLNAEQELLDARGELVSAYRDRYVAAYNLLFSIGKLTADHLGLDVGNAALVSGYYTAIKDRNFGYDKTDDTVWSLTFRP